LALPGCFVTGTDTGAGKTAVAAALVAALRARGTAVGALKPVVTGLDEQVAGAWPPDHELLARVSGQTPEEVAPFRYGPAVSPHLAAELAGAVLEPAALRACVERAIANAEVLVVEGVGGVMVPIAPGYDVLALAGDVGLPLVIAARPGLGTINHTLLTIDAARRAALQIAGVVLTPWPEHPGEIELSNRETIARLGRVPVATLPELERPEPSLLAGVGSLLPLDQWLS